MISKNNYIRVVVFEPMSSTLTSIQWDVILSVRMFTIKLFHLKLNINSFNFFSYEKQSSILIRLYKRTQETRFQLQRRPLNLLNTLFLPVQIIHVMQRGNIFQEGLLLSCKPTFPTTNYINHLYGFFFLSQNSFWK